MTNVSFRKTGARGLTVGYVARMRRTSALSITVAASAVCIAATAVMPGTAGAVDTTQEEGWRVVATGLDNPRQITAIQGDAFLVAEAGKGGEGPCMPGPEGDVVCFGSTGAVTKLTRDDGTWAQSRLATGLPSLATEDGSQAIGPSDVEKGGDPWFVLSVGLGADPAVRDEVGGLATTFGTLLKIHPRTGERTVLADIAGFEADENPDGGEPDSNPTSVLRSGSSFLVTDAGGNSLVEVDQSGEVRTVAVFEDRMVDAPPFLGLPPGTQIPMQAVPTSVVQGRQHRGVLVSQLTGFPFPQGGANIFRVLPTGEPTVFADGLTNVTDLAVGPGGAVYFVQIADEGLLAGGNGSLMRRNPDGTVETVADDLMAPYGVAVRGTSAYVTTCSVCAGGGQVIKVGLN
ncbi:MAG: ScyD/ScyE family protein [Propionibacteriales bacterium]|nr:ScyD/ScyE family protein [Propionibacteriales bacterium]